MRHLLGTCVVRLFIAMLVGVIGFGVGSNAHSQGVLIKDDFLTGNAFRTLPRASQRIYVMGALDGALLAPLFAAPKAQLDWLERCTVAMTYEQATAIVETYMAENAVRWHEPMRTLVYSAMRRACVVTR